MAADDPFTGTWRALPSKTAVEQANSLVLAPSAGGISIQERGGKPTIAKYGEESPFEVGTINVVRIDDHHLATTMSLDGKVLIKETGTVSPDGKQYVRKQEFVTRGSISAAIQYDRVGPVPAGDAFFGTWQQTLPIRKDAGPVTYTIRIDGDAFDFVGSDSSNWKGKLDGKEYKQPEDGQTMQARRIDAQTIELSFKTPEGISATMLWQVKGNTLIRTTRIAYAQGQGRTVEFERVK
jgi:hypothetical protein